MSQDIVINFGMHQGKNINDVPVSYLNWWYSVNKENDKPTPFMKKMMKHIDHINTEIKTKTFRNPFRLPSYNEIMNKGKH
jgi:uncharacterized protein (DUF3820 family)